MCYVKKQKADFGAVSCNVVIFSTFNNLPILSTGGAELLTNLKSYFLSSQRKGKTWAIPCQCQKAASGKKWHGMFSAEHSFQDFTHGMSTAVFDLEVVEQSLEVVLGCEACVEQEAFDAGPFTETSIVELL